MRCRGGRKRIGSVGNDVDGGVDDDDASNGLEVVQMGEAPSSFDDGIRALGAEMSQEVQKSHKQSIHRLTCIQFKYYEAKRSKCSKMIKKKRNNWPLYEALWP